MFTSAMMMGGGAAGATITYTDNAAIVATGTVYTFAARALGTPAVDRIISVGTYGSRSSAVARLVLRAMLWSHSPVAIWFLAG